MEVNHRIESLAKTLGADFFGVADLSPAHDAILEQGGAFVADFPHAVSIGITLFDTIVNRLPQRADHAVAVDYRHHCYDVINQRLDHIVSRLSSVLQNDGYRVLPVPASERVNTEELCGAFSHKMAAHLAGLGWIGKSCLLVTLEMGPRVRWATVLTDAPLMVTGEAMEEQCGTCEKCVEICPVKAFTGQPFRENESRAVRYDASKCDRYLAKMKEKGKAAVCGMCLYICPYGRQLSSIGRHLTQTAGDRLRRG
jgi:epoxyqueuosine reductase